MECMMIVTLLFIPGIPCPEPPTVINATGSGGILFGDVYTYKCMPGFNMSGEPNLNCSDSGRWTGTVPACLSKI